MKEMNNLKDVRKNATWVFWTDEMNEGVYHWNIQNENGFDHQLFAKVLEMSDEWVVTDRNCNIVFEGVNNINFKFYSHGEENCNNIVGVFSEFCDDGRLIDLETGKAKDISASLIMDNHICELLEEIKNL